MKIVYWCIQVLKNIVSIVTTSYKSYRLICLCFHENHMVMCNQTSQCATLFLNFRVVYIWKN